MGFFRFRKSVKRFPGAITLTLAACGGRTQLPDLDVDDASLTRDGFIDVREADLADDSDAGLPECIAAATETVLCGRCGKRTRLCIDGHFTDFSACSGEGVCSPGETATTVEGCPSPATRSRTCDLTCTWGPFGACRGWMPIASPEPLGFEGRSGPIALWTGKEMLIWAGTTAKGAEKITEGAAYDPKTNGWRILPPSPLGLRYGNALTGVWTGTAVLLWGGQTAIFDDTTALLADGAAFDPITNIWTMLPPAPIKGRATVRGVWVAATNEMILWGGATEGKLLADGAAYAPATKTWRMIAAAPIAPRIEHTLVSAGGNAATIR